MLVAKREPSGAAGKPKGAGRGRRQELKRAGFKNEQGVFVTRDHIALVGAEDGHALWDGDGHLAQCFGVAGIRHQQAAAVAASQPVSAWAKAALRNNLTDTCSLAAIISGAARCEIAHFIATSRLRSRLSRGSSGLAGARRN